MKQNVQIAPWPDELEAAVKEFRYKPGYTFTLSEVDRDFSDVARKLPIARGLTLCIFVPCNDSYHPEQYRPVMHYHPVPAATFNRQAWERWLVDRLIDTDTHELCEYAKFVAEDGTERRPFAPLHGPGDNPYVIHELASDLQYRTSYRGEVKDNA